MPTEQASLLTQFTDFFTELFTDLFTDLSTNTTIDGSDLESMSFENIVSNFHFIRPWWLLAIFALLIVLFLLKKIRYYQSPWQHFLPSHLASALLENSENKTTQVKSTQNYHWLKPFIIGSCTILALAGPAWQKLPQPVYQLDRGAVIIMDMSYSMLATDVKPNRLTRARYKAIDLLTLINEGDIGLIAYAGDAFIISPLTQDDNNIALLLPSLSPDIMPVAGANALAALTLADSTLKNAGHISGDIYWFTDDLDSDEMTDVFDWSASNNHKVNILGIGSKEGGPIKLSNGQLLKDNRGAIVVPKLPESRLSSFAQGSRGVYRTMANDNSDIEALTAHLSVDYNDSVQSTMDDTTKEKEQAMLGDQYQEQGPWLLVIILPLLLSYFRRGSSILAITWIMPLALTFGLTTISPSSYAASAPLADPANVGVAAKTDNPDTSTGNSTGSSAAQFWQDLWQTSDQQGQQHYQQEEYQQAATQFKDSQWQGSAHYKAGDYEKALESFQQNDDAQSLYNQGNALAQLQKVDEAIDAYKQALEKDPELADAKDNLAQLEALKKQQEEQQKQEGQDSQDGEQQDSDEKQDGQQNEGDQSKSEDQQSQDQSQDQSKDKSQGDQQQSDEQNEQQSKEQEDSDEDAQDSQKTEEELKEEAAQQAKEDEQAKESEEGEEKSLAQQAIDSKEKETNQKHQQLLNKVTDDPYLLLRNKMSLEYQKRKNDGSQQGVTKKW